MIEDNNISNLSEMICTRISHDIIGNIGAVANAVELLEEGDMDFIDDIKSILKVSSTVLTSRLKFFRMAFGLNNSNLEDINTVKSVSEAYLKTLGNANYPIRLNLELYSPDFSRFAILLIMILADVIVKGGCIEAREVDSSFIAIIHSENPLSTEKINNIKSILKGENSDIVAQYAPVVYLQKLLNNGKKINIIEENTFGFIIKRG